MLGFPLVFCKNQVEFSLLGHKLVIGPLDLPTIHFQVQTCDFRFTSQFPVFVSKLVSGRFEKILKASLFLVAIYETLVESQPGFGTFRLFP